MWPYRRWEYRDRHRVRKASDHQSNELAERPSSRMHGLRVSLAIVARLSTSGLAKPCFGMPRSLVRAAGLLALALSPLLSMNAAAAMDDRWTTWRNARFAYSIGYPAAVFPVSRMSPQKHGIVIESKDSPQLIAAGVEYTRKTLAEQIRIERERLTHVAWSGPAPT